MINHVPTHLTESLTKWMFKNLPRVYLQLFFTVFIVFKKMWLLLCLCPSVCVLFFNLFPFSIMFNLTFGDSGHTSNWPCQFDVDFFSKTNSFKFFFEIEIFESLSDEIIAKSIHSNNLKDFIHTIFPIIYQFYTIIHHQLTADRTEVL